MDSGGSKLGSRKTDWLFSLPGGSPGRAIVLPPASVSASALAAPSALAKSLTLKFLL